MSPPLAAINCSLSGLCDYVWDAYRVLMDSGFWVAHDMWLDRHVESSASLLGTQKWEHFATGGRAGLNSGELRTTKGRWGKALNKSYLRSKPDCNCNLFFYLCSIYIYIFIHMYTQHSYFPNLSESERALRSSLLIAAELKLKTELTKLKNKTKNSKQ